MKTAAQVIHEQAQQAAAQRLKRAATFAALHVKKPLFSKRMGKGPAAVLVRFEWPGVCRVFDPATGDLICESVPGRPDVLSPVRPGA